MADPYGHDTLRSPMTKENVPNNHQLVGDYKEECALQAKCSSKKRKANDDLEKPKQEEVNWEPLYRALEAERVTKAESLLYAYRQESEERENLMKSYNQELEQDNKRLKMEASHISHQKQEIQNLQQQLQGLKTTVSRQKAAIRVYQAFTGATLSNLPVSTNDEDKEELSCDCTVTNPDTKVATTFQLSTVEVKNTQQKDEQSRGLPMLKYSPLDNTNPLPSFLREEIEFDSSQLPPLLQNILRAIFPEEE